MTTTTTPITRYREAFKPIEYPIFYEIYQKAKQSHWTEHEANMGNDFRDWTMASPTTRAIIGGILKGFTISETFVSDYWSDVVCRLFPKHEIVSMARWFAASERVHADAYALLEDTLGLTEYEAFLDDPATKQKLEYLSQKHDDLASLGIFSGATEGVSLFGSFAVLLSFSRNAQFRGLRELISWSILDEQTHSDAGILLYNTYKQELGGMEAETEDTIHEGFETIVKNEEYFLQQPFSKGDPEGITYESVTNFIRSRANERLTRMGLFPMFSFDRDKAAEVGEWFNPLAAGLINHDFFASAKEGSGYVSRPEQRFIFEECIPRATA